MSRAEFYREPWIHPAYFKSTVTLHSASNSVSVSANDGTGALHFQGRSSSEHPLLYQLFFQEDDDHPFPDDLQLGSYITSTMVSRDPPLRSLVFNMPVEGSYVLEAINESEETLFKLVIYCYGDTKMNRPFPGGGNIGYGYTEAAEKAGLQEASRVEGVVVARPGDKVTWRFSKSRDHANHSPLAPAEGERVRMLQRFTARMRQEGRRDRDLARRVKVEEEGEELVVKATVPFGDKDAKAALQIDALDENDVTTNVVNYLFTSDASMAATAALRTTPEQVRQLHPPPPLSAPLPP